jgi:superfamily I DNA/RNA helicase
VSVQPLPLPGPVAVIPSPKAIEQLARDQRTPDPVHLVAELAYRSSNGGVPARIDEEGTTPRLVIYTDRHVVWLYVTDYGDAYRLGHLAPLGFKDHERLLQGALLLQSVAWYAVQHVRDVPRGYSSHWDLIRRAWATVRAARQTRATLPEHHAGYLDLLAEVVEATRDLEVAKQLITRPMHYRRRTSTREERYSARGVYAFTLVRPARPNAGAVIQVADHPELRGRVVRARGNEVIVRFESAVDFASIPHQGSLQELPSHRVYRAQLEAVESLRQGRTANPHLLQVFVDKQLRPYHPDGRALPRDRLDPAQLTAFQRALTVPDMLLVLGPPGTGKTRTITEIAAASAARGERVLVTSHTNRAVDNVLERLPAHVRSVRVGNEDAMTSHAREFMVENQIGSLKEGILSATAGTASRLAEFRQNGDVFDRWMEFLAAQLTDARAADTAAQAQSAALDAVSDRVTAVLRPRMTATHQNLTRCRAAVERLELDRVRWRERRQRALARAETGILAAVFRWLARRRRRRLIAIDKALADARARRGVAEAEHEAVQADARGLLARDPEVTRLASVRRAHQATRDAALAEAGRAAEIVRASLHALVRPLPDPSGLADLERFQDWLGRTVSLLRRRAGLLSEWRDRVREADRDLQHELVRYADVVAATCIGTATTALLAELEFDLAIVDEAGQIALPNLLVPLVRARRSILVGDHHQLPPFLDDDVRRWVDTLAGTRDLGAKQAAEIGDLLRKSAFEQLYGSIGDDHRTMLTIQRRMPETLARFVSQTFYHDVLRTEQASTTADPVFHSPIAMIDTADRPLNERAERERRGRSAENWNQHGFDNEREAELITKLVTQYRRWYQDWGVIVPYRAQADLIGMRLTEALGDAQHISDNVGTVDSFQGGERDLIVYGFTRSNDRGEIGFLKELRRINVAITRARHQLVLVGDTTTLLQSRDRGFGELMRSLVDYLRQAGDLRGSREVEASLERLAEGRP